ncbi:FG-GAP repeat domain-containing protein [Zavarzinella formosa]|uniref:FG-GAP repeat domain-containing protein n=1 Tax=Zavarzinella formosa TaxID=360055 RepID=UPI000315200D|nr:VCBS repeat-containing protein [Zavarzinella formosa]
MRLERRKHRVRPALEPLETRAEPAADLSVDDRLSAAGVVNWLPLEVDTAGVLQAEATPDAGSTEGLRLTLATADNTILMTSEGASGNPLSGQVELHLNPGSYRVGVSAGESGIAYHLSTHLTEAASPTAPLESPGYPKGVAVGDLNGDGFADMAVANRVADTVSLWFGNGDGTFQPPRDLELPEDHQPQAVLMADLNADGRPDIVTANSGDDGSLSVFLADKANPGSFLPRLDVPVGGSPVAVAAGDLDGDGHIDLASASRTGQSLSVLRGSGDGTFEELAEIQDTLEPSAVAIADANGDNKPDLVWTSYQDGFVKILPGTGDGTFDPNGAKSEYQVGNGPVALLVEDVTGDGRQDVVTANNLSGTVSVLAGNPDGTLSAMAPVPVGSAPVSVAVARADGNTTPDLVVANRDDTLSVLLGAGNGTFGPAEELAAGSDQTAAAVADFNGDGKTDLVSANGTPGELRVLLGNGDGTFLSPRAFIVGRKPASVALADIDGDGVPDAVSAGNNSNTIDVALGNGDGTFGNSKSFAVGQGPTSVSLADLNGDGRIDAVCSNEIDNTVSVLLGNGDGTFLPAGTYPVGDRPQAIVARDIDGDGIPDLVTADADSNTLTVWWGKGDGTFENQLTIDDGEGPIAVTVADMNQDGRPDLVSANEQSSDLSVILSDANAPRSFQPRSNVNLGNDAFPVSVAAADINGDGLPDLVSGSKSGIVAVFTQNPVAGIGGEPFQRLPDVPAGSGPYGLIVTDLNSDGHPDLAVSDSLTGDVSVSLGDGNGQFQDPFTVPAGKGAIYLATADLNDDGRPDLVTANSRESTLGVLLGPFDNADSPTASTPLRSAPPRYSPVLVDLDGDGLTDSITRDRSGNILFRKGQNDANQPFAAPRLLNASPDQRARDIVAWNTGDGEAIAAIDLEPDAELSTGDTPVYRISKYTVNATDQVKRELAFTTTLLPTGIASGNLDGSERDALILIHALNNRVTIALPDRFDSPIVRPTGENPTNVLVTDVDGDQRPDLLISDSVGGDVTVLHNDTGHTFTDATRFRLGGDLSGADDTGSVLSYRKPAGLVAGDFFPGGGPDDLAVLLQGSHQLAVLKNNDRGGFLNPSDQWVTPTTRGQTTSDLPGPLVSGNFDSDNITDVAFLDRDSGEVWVYRGLGNGHFEFLETVPAGVMPEGLTAWQNPNTNRTDLLVGDPFGDVLRLAGDGDGRFEPPPPLTGTQTSLAVMDGADTSEKQVLVVNQKTNEANIQTVTAKGKTQKLTTLTAPASDTQQAPGDGIWANLNSGSSPDLIVVGTGSNDVVIYRSLEPDANGRPSFAPPERYAVGTNPVSVLAQDINGDGIKDLLVTNRGSNDVSILFGGLASGHWTATPGPRVSSGGIAPVASTLRDLNGDGRPELIVTNSQSGPGATGGSLVAMSDRGFGYFNANTAQVTPLPGIPLTPPVFVSGSGVVPMGDGNLLGIDPNTLRPVGDVFDGGGIREINALSDGRLVAYRDDGVEVLSADSNGLYHSGLELAPLTGIPSEPTALEVLETQSGFRALVASAGSDQLFVFDLPVSQGVGLEGSPTESPVVSKTTVLSPNSLAVVVTLLAGGLSEDGSPDNGNGDDTAEVVADAPVTRLGVQVVEEEENVSVAHGQAEPVKILPSADAERELEGTRLYRPTEESVDPKEKTAAPSGKNDQVESAKPWNDETIREDIDLASDDPPEKENDVKSEEIPSPLSQSKSDVFATVMWMTFLVTVMLQPKLAGTRRPSLPGLSTVPAGSA